MKPRISTESGEAPGWQGATRENSSAIRLRSNAERSVQPGCSAARMQRGFLPRAPTANGSLSWRVLVDEALPGAANMARDHALAASVRPGEGTVRFYRWELATLSFGRNEPVTVGYRELLRRHPEMGAVRRPTGGRAVIHDRELTYSVVLPARAFGGLRLAYRKINEGLLEGLRRLGVDASGASGRALPPDAGPCFVEPAEGEVVVAGRKLVGSAQARIGGAVLQHGSLLLVADQSPLMVGAGRERGGGNGGAWRVTGDEPVEARGGRPVTLAEVLGEIPPWNRLVQAFSLGFARVFGGTWHGGAMTERERTLAHELELRYGSRKWTWRR